MDSATTMESMSKAIQSVPALLEAIMAMPISSWIVLLILLGWIIANRHLPSILERMERKEKRQIEAYDAYLAQKDFADDVVLATIREFRDAHYFKVATRINAEGAMRRALVSFHDSVAGRISWHQLRFAYPHLELSLSGEIKVKTLSFGDKASYIYNSFVTYLSLCFVALLFTSMAFTSNKSVAIFVMGAGGMLFAAFVAALAARQNWPMNAAKRVQEELSSQFATGSQTAE